MKQHHPTQKYSSNAVLGLLSLALLCVSSAQADDLRLTLYPGNLALIQEQRQVDLDGSSHLRLERVPSSLRPETLSLRINGKPAHGHRLLSRTATRDRLLRANLGKSLELVRIDPSSGRESRLDATLIGIDGNDAIVDTNQGIQVINRASAWSLIFPRADHGFVHRPVLEALLQKAWDGKAEVDMRYLASGVGWRMDYVAELSRDNESMGLQAWATLDNGSDLDMKDAQVSLIAGDVNRAPTPQPRMARAEVMLSAAPAMDKAGVSVAAQGGYHRYSLPSRISLQAGESRQTALFNAEPIPVSIRHSLKSFDTGSYWRPASSQDWRPADMAVVLKNNEPELGVAMPGGTVRIYQGTPDGGSMLLGETAMGNQAKGETVVLNTGKAFDVKGRRLQTEFRRVSRKESQSSWRIELRNGGKREVTVRVDELLPEYWELLDSSMSFDKPDARTLRWEISVPANGEASVSYRIKVSQP
ncbi:MAG: DUF4139 domain-containing protein [Gammaproteobacteria bacterium]